MKRYFFGTFLGLIFLCLNTDLAYAGMPFYKLTDMAKLRFDTMSFFIAVYFFASYIIFRLWNFLQNDFEKLPRLSFKKALALVMLWGLAFHLVLVMIAGTRELMTPGAWEKAGVTYKIASDSNKQLMEIRTHKLEQLRIMLWSIAEKNGGHFPSINSTQTSSTDMWLTPDGKQKYLYVKGLSVSKTLAPLAYEPDNYGNTRMVLFTNGMIDVLPMDAISNLNQNNIKTTSSNMEG